MKKDKRSGRGGSYFVSAPGADRVLLQGPDQTPVQVKTPPEAKSPKAQPTKKGAE